MIRKATYEELEQRVRVLEEQSIQGRQAEEGLRKSEEQYRILSENSPSMIYLLDVEGNVLFVNQRSAAQFGLKPDDIIGVNIRDLFPERIVTRHKQAIDKVIREGKILHSELSESFPTGERWIDARIVPVWNKENGNVSAVLGISHDITDRKRAEEALSRSEENFRHSLDNSPLGVRIITEEGETVYANRAILDIYGFGSSEEWLRTPREKRYTPESYAEYKIRKEKRKRGDHSPSEYEMSIVRTDGEVRRLQVFRREIVWDGEKQFQIIYNDITDRKRAEETLRKEWSFRNAIIDNVAEGLCVYHETTEYPFIRFTIWNDRMTEITGYTVEQINRLGWYQTVYPDPELQAKAIERMKRMRQGEDLRTEEWEITRADGGKRILNISTSIVESDDGLVHILALMRNVTEHKRMEEELHESEQRYRELSVIDDLTQLYNSRHFYIQLKSEIDRSNRYGQPLTLLLLDIDNFKAFNDAYGHVEGDEVLLRLGQVVKRCLRQTDSAYRYGGEEFTIILPMTRNEDGAVTAERILTEFKKETFSPEPGQEVHLTVSIGVAQYQTQEDTKAFVHRVDQRMYQGKKNGKDRVCCEPQHQERFKG